MANGKNKIRLLFVISQFVQGGSERFLYEICRALDKEKFEIEILTLRKIDKSQYYYPKLRELGIPVHEKLSIVLYLHRSGRLLLLRKLLRFVYSLFYRFYLRQFFRAFDIINIIQIENYYCLQELFKDNEKMLIYLMSSSIQYNYNVYADCLPDRRYRFVLVYPEQKRDMEMTGSLFHNAELLCFPLALDFDGREALYQVPQRVRPFKIGLFTRLSPEKPIGHFFHALHSLLKAEDVTLHIYGSGDPGIFHETLTSLNIMDKVFFEGHRENLKDVVKADGLSLVWMLSLGSFIGYGSIELASYGMPIIHWDLGASSVQQPVDVQTPVHRFSDLASFVAYNKTLLSDREKIEKLGKDLRRYVFSHYEIKDHIRILEEYFELLRRKLLNA